jgi:hypothetical protein
MPFKNYSLTKGGQLTIGQIFSPDFLEGASGWEIRKDGSVEFNNGTFRGTISGGTLIISQGSGATFEQIEIDGATGVTTWSKYQSPTVVIRQILATGTDLLYADPGSGGPQGGLVRSDSPVAGTDGFGNPYQAGIFLYETGGNSLLGLMWNTVAGSQPLLALFPDSAFGFTGNAPFILAADANKGLTSEFMSLTIGSGNPPSPATANISKIVLWSGSPDGTTSVAHVGVYGGNPSKLIADFSASGIAAANPNVTNVAETWHTLTPANGWANVAGNVALKYRLMPDNSVTILGTLSMTSASSATIGTLPAGYRPATQQAFVIGTNAGGVAASDRVLQVTTGGIMSLLDLTITSGGVAFISGKIYLDA